MAETTREQAAARRENTGRKRLRRSNVLIGLGVLLLTGALGLTLYNRWDSNRAAAASEAIAKTLEEDISTNREEKEETRDAALPQPEPESTAFLSMPTETVNGYAYIGILDIPSVGVHLPVMHDWDMERLKISACRYTGSYYEDDLVICGHNYAKTFSPIRWTAIGAEVTFTTVDGTVIPYKVSNIETIQPTAVSEMVFNDNNSDSEKTWDLTLFTCNVGGQTRCAVRCIRTDGKGGA